MSEPQVKPKKVLSVNPTAHESKNTRRNRQYQRGHKGNIHGNIYKPPMVNTPKQTFTGRCEELSGFIFNITNT